MLKIISNLPNCYNPFTKRNYAIYVLDDYAVHLMPEIRKALFQRGYILVVMGRGITAFIQANNTHLHRQLKAYHCHLEMELIMEKLRADKKKVPTPTREEMINMTVTPAKKIDLNFAEVFKQLFVTNKLDGSEDCLVSDKLFDLIGSEMVESRKKLMESRSPDTIQAVIKNMIPPKGIRRKNIEGAELLDFAFGDAVIEPAEFEEDSEEENNSNVDDDEPSEADPQQVPATDDITMEESASANGSRIASLVDICSDKNINKDARLLDAIQKAFNDNESPVLFKAHAKKIKAAYIEAWRSVKKRIKQAKKVKKVEK